MKINTQLMSSILLIFNPQKPCWGCIYRFAKSKQSAESKLTADNIKACRISSMTSVPPVFWSARAGLPELHCWIPEQRTRIFWYYSVFGSAAQADLQIFCRIFGGTLDITLPSMATSWWRFQTTNEISASRAWYQHCRRWPFLGGGCETRTSIYGNVDISL